LKSGAQTSVIIRIRDGSMIIWFQTKGSFEKDDFKVLLVSVEKALRKWLKHGHGKNPKTERPLFYALTRIKGERLTAPGSTWYLGTLQGTGRHYR